MATVEPFSFLFLCLFQLCPRYIPTQVVSLIQQCSGKDNLQDLFFTSLSRENGNCGTIQFSVSIPILALPKDIPTQVVSLIQQCWDKRPTSRPDFSSILKKINKAKKTKKSVLDCMMEAVEQYVEHLEEKVTKYFGIFSFFFEKVSGVEE